MAGMMDGIWEMADAISYSTGRNVSRTTATVSRIDNEGVVWVHLPGGIDETPVNGVTTSDVYVGDVVQVEISNGRCSVFGNTTSPSVGSREITVAIAPVDEKADAAIEQAIAATEVSSRAQAIAEATNQHFWWDNQGAHVAYATKTQYNANPSLAGPNQISNANGVLLLDGETYLSAFTPNGQYIYDGHGNTNQNLIATFTRDGIDLYTDVVSAGQRTRVNALSIDALSVPYGSRTNIDLGVLGLGSFEKSDYAGPDDYGVIFSPSGYIMLDGSGDNLGGKTYAGIHMAGIGEERGNVSMDQDGVLTIASEARDRYEGAGAFTPGTLRAAASIILDSNATYSGNYVRDYTFVSADPTITATSNKLALVGETNSHIFEMDDVIDALLNSGDMSQYVLKSELLFATDEEVAALFVA